MTEKAPPFELTPEERNSALWQRLLAHFEARRERARQSNDFPQSETSTATLRGEIAACGYLIGLNRPRPPKAED